MFSKLRLWLVGSSGLREATRDAAREVTREGLTEGFRLGLEDFIDQMTAGSRPEPKTISTNGNGHHDSPGPLTATDLRGLRKSDLLSLAEERGIEADEEWTVARLKEELIAD